MIRRNRKTRKYHAPFAKVTQMALESNFCQTGQANVQADMINHINGVEDPDEVLDIEF